MERFITVTLFHLSDRKCVRLKYILYTPLVVSFQCKSNFIRKFNTINCQRFCLEFKRITLHFVCQNVVVRIGLKLFPANVGIIEN